MSPLATTGNAQRGLHGGHGVVLGLAAVALLARAAVHRDHRDAGVLGGARQAQRVAFAVAPAAAHLQRHRHAVRRAGGDHGLDDGQRQRLVPHQRRAGPLVAHLLRRATHVDVDDLRAAVDVVARGVGHHRGVDAGDLHRDRRALAVVVGAARGLQRIAQVGPLS